MGGIQLISLGILGEYIARIFLETKQRPIYTIDHSRSMMGRRPPSTRRAEPGSAPNSDYWLLRQPGTYADNRRSAFSHNWH
jgi:hypothetical protein